MSRTHLSRSCGLLALLLSCAGAPVHAQDCNGNGMQDALELIPQDVGFVQDDRIDLLDSHLGPVTGDFDGDGDTDFLGLGIVDRSLVAVIVWNEDTGLRRERVEIPMRVRSVRALTAADVNSDGLDDLVFADRVVWSPESMLFVVGSTGSGFEPRNEISMPELSSIDEIVVHDFNVDGQPDILCSNSGGFGTGQAWLLLATDQDAFVIGEEFPVESTIVFAGDLDHDGDADLVDRLAGVYLNENGEFRQNTAASHESGSHTIVVDMNRDGHPDIVNLKQPMGHSQYRLRVLAGDGAGAFAQVLGWLTSLAPSDLVADDLDLDGDIDLAIGSRSSRDDSSESLVVYLNDGGTSLTGPFAYGKKLRTGQVFITRIDNDARPDAVLMDWKTSSLWPFYQRSVPLQSDCNGNSVPDECEPELQADCDSDGVPDLCEILYGGARDCDGNGVPDDCDLRSEIRVGEWQDVAGQGGDWAVVADFDGDGDGDIAATASEFLDEDMVFPDSGVYLTFWQNESAVSTARLAIDEQVVGVAAGDFDSDGDNDLAAVADVGGPYELTVFLNDGSGAFSTLEKHWINDPTVSFADVDGDGVGDLFSTNNLFLGQGDGSFQVSIVWQGSDLPYDLRARLAPDHASGDIDGDGLPDSLRCTRGVITRAFGQPDGSLGSYSEVDLGIHATTLNLVDMDGDADPDLVATARSYAACFVNVGGSFVLSHEADLYGTKMTTLGDLNDDGLPDLVAATARPNPSCRVALNETIFPRSPDADRNGIPDSCLPVPFRRGDANGDGKFDIADPIATLMFLFAGAEAPPCLESADADNSWRVNITDPVLSLEFLFGGGRPPAPPWTADGDCGLDPDELGSPGDLGCNVYPEC